jgi:hypothetical protein
MKMRPAVSVVLRFLRHQPCRYHLISRHTSFTFLFLSAKIQAIPDICKQTSGNLSSREFIKKAEFVNIKSLLSGKDNEDGESGTTENENQNPSSGSGNNENGSGSQNSGSDNGSQNGSNATPGGETGGDQNGGGNDAGENGAGD